MYLLNKKYKTYFFDKKIIHKLIYFLVFLIVVYQNAQILNSPTTGDEIFNLSHKGSKILDFGNFFDQWASKTAFFLLGGDFSPLHTLIILAYQNFFYLDVFSTKIFHLSIIVFAVFVTSFLFFKITKNRNLSLLYLITISSFFHYQNWHDVFLIFPLHVIPQFIFFISSIIFFYKYFDEKNIFFYRLSFLFVLLTSFMSVVIVSTIIPILVVLNFYFKNKFYSKELLILCATPTCLIILILYIKFFSQDTDFIIQLLSEISNRNSNYDGRQLSNNFISSFKSFFIQASSALPLIYFIKDNFYAFSNFYDAFTFSIYDSIFLVIYFFIFYIFLSNLKINLSNKTKKLIIFVGFFLILVAAPISFSSKYVQQLSEKGIGYGYIYNFYQFFGVSFILFSFLITLLQKQEIFRKLIISLIISIISFTTIMYNRTITKNLFAYKDIEIKAYQYLARTNFFDNVEEYSRIFFETSMVSHWNSPHFLATQSGKKIFSTWHDTRLGDYSLVSDNLILDKKNYYSTSYHLNRLKLKKISKNRYKPIKFVETFDRENITWGPKKYRSKKIDQVQLEKIKKNSNKTYYLKSFLIDGNILIALFKIKEFYIPNHKIKEIISSEVKIYSFNENYIYNFVKDVNVSDFISQIENKEIIFKKKKKIKKKNKIVKIHYPWSNIKVNNFERNENFYSGSIDCKKKNIKKINTFFERQNTKYINDNFTLTINNFSNSVWMINDFSKKNPVTLRTILKNKQNSTSKPGPSLANEKIILEPGETINFFINQMKFSYILNQVNWRHADVLEFHLVHEGKQFFSQDKLFKICKIDLL